MKTLQCTEVLVSSHVLQSTFHCVNHVVSCGFKVVVWMSFSSEREASAEVEFAQVIPVLKFKPTHLNSCEPSELLPGSEDGKAGAWGSPGRSSELNRPRGASSFLLLNFDCWKAAIWAPKTARGGCSRAWDTSELLVIFSKVYLGFDSTGKFYSAVCVQWTWGSTPLYSSGDQSRLSPDSEPAFWVSLEDLPSSLWILGAFGVNLLTFSASDTSPLLLPLSLH